MFKFRCSGCGTNYSSPSLEPPPGIKWSDGHVCTPALIQDIPIRKSVYNPNTEN